MIKPGSFLFVLNLKNCLYILLAIMFLQGCVAIQPFPVAARAGDTITLAVGSPDGMTKDNTSVTFQSLDPAHPSNTVPITLTPRSIIKMRPDATSDAAAFDSNIEALEYNSSHGAWLSVVLIDLPDNLPEGPAVLKVVTTASYWSQADIADTEINMEVLSGLGSSNPFMYERPYYADPFTGDFSSLEPLRQVVFRSLGTNSGGSTDKFFAAEFKFTIPTNSTTTGLPVTDNYIQVIKDDYGNTGDNHVNMNWSRVGDEFTVIYTKTNDSLHFLQTRFSVVLSKLPSNEFIEDPGPKMNSVRFFDENGNVLTGTPLVSDYSVTLEHL